ncbi:MAG: glycosyltransferase [Clostridium sp.]|uniref:glycosyltransferase n=1 Tax=Clostridium sp. TaxID=1506 RepID=UPI003028DEF7
MNEFANKSFDNKNKPIISSFGGMRHEKGFVNILKATKKLNLKFMLLSRLDVNSKLAMDEYNKLLSEAEDVGDKFKINTECLEIKEVLTKLKMSDAIIFAYPEETKYSATSGAIRQALCTGVPVLCTDAPRFSDLNDAVIKISPSVEGIIEGIKKLTNNDELRMKLFNSSKKFVQENSWENIAQMYMDVVNSVPNEKIS